MIYEVYALPKSQDFDFGLLGMLVTNLLGTFQRDGVINARDFVEVRYLDGDLKPWGGVPDSTTYQSEAKELREDPAFILRQFLASWKGEIQRTHRVFDERFGRQVKGFARLRRRWVLLGVYEEHGRPRHLELGFPSVEMGPEAPPEEAPEVNFWDALD